LINSIPQNEQNKSLPALLCAIATEAAFFPTAFGDSRDKPSDKSNIDDFWANLKKLRGH
jgi:hypothetical protein